MASQDDILTLLQQLNARSAATVRPQVEPTKRTNAVMQNRNVGPKLTDTVSAVPNLPTGSVDTINAQNKLSAYSMDKQVQYPKLTDQIQAMEAGASKPSGALGTLANLFDNPVAKTVLAPLLVLDTGRRGIISGVREIADAIDGDKKTKASLNDWFRQTKDTSYGFGTAFPMKGGVGRVVGFLGDVLLDPLTYATLGTSIPTSSSLRVGLAGAARIAVREGAEELVEAGARGVARQAAEQIAETKLRSVLGRKSIATAEGRATMAGLVGKMGGSDELVKNIAAEGRRAFRTSQEGVEMAQRLGLNRSGIYYFGSRVRVPFSGPIAEFLETGLVKSRLGIMKSAPGEWISKNFTTAGTSSARSLKALKSGLAKGTLPANEAALAAKMLSHEALSRAQGNIARDTFAKLVKYHLASNAARGELLDADVLENIDNVYRYLDIKPENWEAAKLPPLVPGSSQDLAYRKVQNMFRQFHTDVENQFKLIDPNFTLNKIEDYFPHMMTDEAFKYISNNSSPYAEQIRQYLKLNMTDPSASFKHRGLVEGAPWFGKPLSKEDVAGGLDRLNQLATERGFTGGNFFETNLSKVLQRYGEHYAEQFSTAEFMRLAMQDDILRMAREMEVVDEDWVKATVEKLTSANAEFRIAAESLNDAGSGVIQVVNGLISDVRSTLKEQGKALRAAAREAGTPEQRLEQLTAAEAKFGLAVKAYEEKFAKFAENFADQSELVAALRSQMDETVEQIRQTQTDLAEFTKTYTSGRLKNIDPKSRNFIGESLVEDLVIGQDAGSAKLMFRGEVRTLDEVEKILDSSVKASAKKLAKMQDDFALATEMHDQLNDILNKFLKGDFEDVVDDITGETITAEERARRGTGSRALDEIYDILVYSGVADAKSAPAVRSIDRNWIAGIWNDASNPQMVELKKLIDPNGQLSIKGISQIRMEDYYPSVEQAVKKIDTQIKKAEKQIRDIFNPKDGPRKTQKELTVQETNAVARAKKAREALIKERDKALARRGKPGEVMIPGIRTRIARGLTVGDNMLEMREAAVWLILRDIKLGVSDIASGALKTGDELVGYVSGNFGRYEGLVRSLAEADTVQGIFRTKGLTLAQKELKAEQANLLRIQDEFYAKSDAGIDTPEDLAKYSADYDAAFDKLQAAQSRVDAMTKKMNKDTKEVFNRIGDSSRFKDVVQNLATHTSEYYLHRETVIQFSRLATQLDYFGLKPTQLMYNRILASVADGELRNMREFSARLNDFTDVMKRLRDAVTNSGLSGSDKRLALRSQLEAIFDPMAGTKVDNPQYAKAVADLEDAKARLATVKQAEPDSAMVKTLEEQIKGLEANVAAIPKKVNNLRDADLIREFMPEIELVITSNKLDTIERQLLRDPEAIGLLNEMRTELAQISARLGSGSEQRAVIRKPNIVTTTPKKIVSTGARPRVESQAAREARFGLGEATEVTKNEFERTLRLLQEQYQKGTRIARGVTKGADEPLMQPVGDALAGIDLRQFGVDNTGRLNDYRSRFRAIESRIRSERKAAQDKAARATGTKGSKSQKAIINKAIQSPEEFAFGFISEFSNALDYGGIAIDDFFASLVGGQKLRRGTQDFDKIIKKGKVISSVRSAEFDTIDEFSSYLGKLKATVDDRRLALRYLADDPDIPTSYLVEGQRAGVGMEPSGWVLTKNLRGQQAYADALEEHADRLLSVLERDRGVLKDLKKKNAAKLRVEKEYDKLVGGPGMAVETPRTKRLQQIELKNARAEQKIAELKATAMHVRAETMKLENDFAKNMAHFNREDVNYMLSLGGPDMADFQFTVDEWDALWSENIPEESLKSLQGRKGSLSRQLSNLPKDVAENRWQGALNPKVRANLEKAQLIRDQIAVVDAMIAKHQARASAMGKFGRVEKVFARRDFQELVGIDMSKKPTMSSAEAIFSIGNSRNMTQYFKDMNVKFPPKEQIDARKAFLEAAWKGSDEYAHLEAVRSLSDEMSWYRHEQFVSSRDKMLKRHAELRDEISKLRAQNKDNVEKVSTLEQQIGSLLEKTEPVYGKAAKGKGGKDTAARAKARAAKIREPEQIERTAKEYVAVNQDAIDSAGTMVQQNIIAENQKFEEVARMLENLQFNKIVDMELQTMALDYISTLNAQQKALLKQKMQLADRLAKEQGVLERMYADGSPSLSKADVRMQANAEAVRVAQVRYDNAQTFVGYSAQESARLEADLADLQKLAERGKTVKGQVKRGNDMWVDEANQLLADSIDLWMRTSGDEIPSEIRAVATSLIDARNEFIRATFNKTEAEVERALAKGVKEMAKNKIPVDAAGVRLAGGQTTVVKVFDDGFVQLSKYFPEIGVREEVAEIFQNVHRLQQPLMARELSKFLSKYTTFFKAYATLSPGFHFRNSLSNGFMLFAAGSDPRNLGEGLKWSRSWIAASKRGDTFDEWILSVPQNVRARVSDAFKAAAASGGGLTDDLIQGSVPFGTKGSRKLGRWIEQHSRFLLAYDGIAAGMDMPTAAARVKRYLIDYQDLSTADAYMRQIMPFWMWTSRNLPMQLSNMWMNPRAYAIYNNLKRNIEEKDPDKPVPLWMRELGAFKLPGTNFYATPDLGFNRINQQIQELRDPRRALANVSPILRLPIELIGGRQLYSNRQFEEQPVEVKDGAGALLQPLLALAGYGETTGEGKKFVDDKAYYALRNLIPFLGTAERLTPSIQTYQQRGYVNPLLGFLGVPTRQLTEQDMQGELARRRREIQNIVSRERTLQGNE